MDKRYDCIVIGGGPAGMAAALSVHEHGVQRVLIIEREKVLGGILNQCIHNGFGVHHFKEELTGPEYSERMIAALKETDIEVLLDSMVLKVDENKNVHAVNATDGYLQLQAKAIVLAMGCRERTRGAVQIYGSRPSGVFTAGTAQRLINIDGYMPGKRVVILGSGDIGLVIARRMTLEGAAVEAVVELMPYSNGLARNTVECLFDYNIPLLLSHTIVKVHGEHRVSGVTIAKVDEHYKPIKETERYIDCDTLLLSVGLIPENEISRNVGVKLDERTHGPVVDALRQTSIDGIFACGNVLHVHDVVDFVTEESQRCGDGVAQYIHDQLHKGETHQLIAGEGVSYVVPQKLNTQNMDETVKIYLRVNQTFERHHVVAMIGDQIIAKKRELKFMPAQMITLHIKQADLLKCQGNEIIVSVRGLS